MGINTTMDFAKGFGTHMPLKFYGLAGRYDTVSARRETDHPMSVTPRRTLAARLVHTK